MRDARLSSVIAEIRGCGGAVSVDERNAEITVGARELFSIPDSRALFAARELIFSLLNDFETAYSIKVYGVPPCFLPGAEDHIASAGPGESAFSRLPQCRSCAMRKTCRGLAAGIEITSSFRAKLLPVPDAPRELCIEASGACNYGCRACFSGGGRGPSRKLILSLLGQARREGVKTIRFTGGEPLLRPDLPELLRRAHEDGFFTILNTNATLLDGRRLALVEDYVDDALVSLQGYDAASERFLCGRDDLFRAKLLNIARLRGSRVPVLRLGTVISRVLLDNFKHYRDLVEFLRPQQWEFYRPMLSSPDPLFDIGPDDVRRLLSLLDGAGLDGVELKVANPVPLCLFGRKERNTRFFGARFDDGHTRMVLAAPGFLKPSYCIGLNLGTDLRAAWRKPFMRRLRGAEWIARRCAGCRDFAVCGAGSRFAARVSGGDYFAPDPWMPVHDERKIPVPSGGRRNRAR